MSTGERNLPERLHPWQSWGHSCLIDVHRLQWGKLPQAAGVPVFGNRFKLRNHILEKETFKHKDLNHENFTYISFFLITIFSDWNDKNPDKSCWPEQGSNELITNFEKLFCIESGDLILFCNPSSLTRESRSVSIQHNFYKQSPT